MRLYEILWLELLLKICNNTSAFSCSTHNSFITSASRYLFHKFQSMLSISFDWSSCKNKSIFLSACIWDFATDNWSYPYACLENSVLFLTCRLLCSWQCRSNTVTTSLLPLRCQQMRCLLSYLVSSLNIIALPIFNTTKSLCNVLVRLAHLGANYWRPGQSPKVRQLIRSAPSSHRAFVPFSIGVHIF